MSSHRESGIVVGTARSERATAIDLVRQWFDAFNQGDAPAAMRVMAPTLVITDSGGLRFTGFEDYLQCVARRYASLRKQVEAFEACEAAGGVAVYARGLASGCRIGGEIFESVRWCDRFLVEQGLIVELQTWSDLTEALSAAPT